MQVTVDVLEGLQRKLTIEIPAEEVSQTVLTKLKKVQKTTKMDGFRPGKVPMTVVKQKYEAAVRQEVLGEIIESSYGEAIKSENLVPAGQPEIEPVSGFAAGENFVYAATLEVVPEFEVKGLDSLTIKKPITSVQSTDVENMIETLRKQAVTWDKSSAPAVEGDRVMINFTGRIDGELFEGGHADNIPVVLGAKQMLPEFETALFDQATGQTLSVDVNFPEDYHGQDVAGKQAQFEINVLQVEKPVLPEVNEAFIKQFGIGDGSQSGLETAIRENMERELEGGIRRIINQQVMQHLVDANQFVIPEGMVNQEKSRMAKEANLESQVADEEAREKIINEQFDPAARRRVQLGLIMGKLFESQEITPDSKRVESHIEKVAATYEQPGEVRDYYKNNPEAVEQVYAQVMEDQLIENLLSNAEVVEESKSFDEIMQREEHNH